MAVIESKLPVSSDKDFEAVKEKYLSQVVRKRRDQAYNIKVLQACRWIHDEKCDAGKPGGVIAYTNMSNIYYGKGYSPDKTKLAIFHELDHMRKGNQHRNFSSLGIVVNSHKDPGRVTIRRPDRTIFFEEGFAHANSYSFYKDAYSTGETEKDKEVFKEIDDFYKGSPYKYNVDVTSQLIKLLNSHLKQEGKKMDLAKFEQLVMKRNKKGDETLDNMFYKITGDKTFFKKIEKRLNYYGTYIYQKTEDKKPDFDADMKARDAVKEVDAMIVYAQKIQDGYAKKLSFFDRLFNRYGKQRKTIESLFGQRPNYASSFYAMIDGDTTTAFAAHREAELDVSTDTYGRDDDLYHETGYGADYYDEPEEDKTEAEADADTAEPEADEMDK